MHRSASPVRYADASRTAPWSPARRTAVGNNRGGPFGLEPEAARILRLSKDANQIVFVKPSEGAT